MLPSWAADADLAAELLDFLERGVASGCHVFKLHGYFQDRRYFARVQRTLPELFKHKPSLDRSRTELKRLLPEEQWAKAVTINYGLTDAAGGLEVADDYFPRAVAVAAERLGSSMTCIFSSDDIATAMPRSEGLTQCTGKVWIPKDVDAVTSFYMMGLIPNGIVCASSYSYWAAIAGSKSFVIAPDMAYRMFDYVKQHGWSLIPTRIKGCKTCENGCAQVARPSSLVDVQGALQSTHRILVNKATESSTPAVTSAAFENDVDAAGSSTVLRGTPQSPTQTSDASALAAYAINDGSESSKQVAQMLRSMIQTGVVRPHEAA
eukprot:TRINITY_DN28140_c0_g1_i2.p2 TRINITY_DN28140_c0_g1~~TRINITY_DN28140_c0_g1_i2.p2  ORF type:complete len:320 (-),score=50.94 TRINITY_DN28140_c0_g1_i2:4-963(-)